MPTTFRHHRTAAYGDAEVEVDAVEEAVAEVGKAWEQLTDEVPGKPGKLIISYDL